MEFRLTHQVRNLNPKKWARKKRILQTDDDLLDLCSIPVWLFRSSEADGEAMFLQGEESASEVGRRHHSAKWI